MVEKLNLGKFVPEDQGVFEVELETELTDVVARISVILPKKAVWELFSSRPDATGGKVRFPYCRVDTLIIAGNDSIQLAQMKRNSSSLKFEKFSRTASLLAIKALLWVEIGFSGN